MGRCIGVKWFKLMFVLDVYGGYLLELVKKKSKKNLLLI